MLCWHFSLLTVIKFITIEQTFSMSHVTSLANYWKRFTCNFLDEPDLLTEFFRPPRTWSSRKKVQTAQFTLLTVGDGRFLDRIYRNVLVRISPPLMIACLLGMFVCDLNRVESSHFPLWSTQLLLRIWCADQKGPRAQQKRQTTTIIIHVEDPTYTQSVINQLPR